MATNSDFTIDVKSAIGDFRQYDKATQKRFAATMATTAWQVQGKQWNILHSQVKKWTGRLGSSLTPVKKQWYHYDIGPLKNRVVYAWWIEAGGLGTAFTGYHYVRDSLKGMNRKLSSALKKDIDAGN